ncbi:hypothetical protein DN752_11250 [Echinicola strongylocentroti]|uniref:Uncharacterized protein n=1 Tax=Echinicola strongylocentroti TaxID=1795355 RepID=A0A2Z4IIB7_9BACT|nr:hypothetical protein [Echinicola strongylocentroti]AWW30655.1 hypothetical protein DN752_11250 [Echinicola strongylocentroti]
MNDKINLNYLENYAHDVSEKICSEYFGTKRYMSGQEIIQLTPSSQVNFMVIKTLFEKWNAELEKLKANPYFDYKDMAVSEALKEFMNVLSRAIKIEHHHFLPLLEIAVIDTVLLALDPMVYFWGEIEKSQGSSPHGHLKASRKYIKWHENMLNELMEKGGHGYADQYKTALSDTYQQLLDQLAEPKPLLEGLAQVQPIVWEQLLPETKKKNHIEDATPDETPLHNESPEAEDLEETQVDSEEKVEAVEKNAFGSHEKDIDPALAWAKFEAEQSGILKGPITSMDDGLAINQRFMFTKKLFDGNPDLMGHAFKSIDECDSFVEAIDLVNDRYVDELNWDKESDEVNEFLHLIYRKFDEK